MATSITTIQSTDLITNSRADINNNFDSLLVNKIETDVLTTDSTFATASDSKIPSQLAVKQYVDAGGNVNASTTVKGIVEEADLTETLAGTAVGATGARLFVNPSSLDIYTEDLNTITSFTNDEFDGSTTPVPAFIHSDGSINLADADDANRLFFHGFSKTNASTNRVDYLGGTSSTSTTISVTVPAGTNRYMVAFALLAGTTTLPTAVAWNSLSLSNIIDVTGTRAIGIWGLALGTGAETTANIVYTGASASASLAFHVHIYENVDQSAPYNDTDSVTATSTSVSTPSMTKLDFGAMYVYSAIGDPTISLGTAGTTTRFNTNTGYQLSGDVFLNANSTVTATRGSSDTISVAGLVLNGAPVTCELKVGRRVTGFSGLTPGAKYYVSNSGTISTSAGGTSIPVGTALSATEILTKQTYP